MIEIAVKTAISLGDTTTLKPDMVGVACRVADYIPLDNGFWDFLSVLG